MRILNVLGQRPGFTGSGILVQELWKCGVARGDEQRLVCAGYLGDNWREEFGAAYTLVTFSKYRTRGDLPFRVPGMSDVMPYTSARYRDLSAEQLEAFVAAYTDAVNHVIRAFGPDVLQIHHLWALTGLGGLAKDLPWVVTVHGTDLKLARTARKHRRRVVRNLDKIDHLFCVSRDMAWDAVNEYGIARDRISVLGNGFNPQVFRTSGLKAVARGHVVLCAGKFVSWKGFRYAIRASARVRIPHQLVLLGSGTHEERKRLEAEAGACGVTVLFPGHVPHFEVAKWMRRADVFVLPSLHEPFGLVLLEAMACGCRVVTSASGGPADIVSANVVARGFASLIAPLRKEKPEDEEVYVRDFARAIERQLQSSNDCNVRTSIAASIAHMTWASVYERMRAKYVELSD